ncbi:MAG: hypothetical protein AABX30_02395 [Nanoarchaeota archaeon]
MKILNGLNTPKKIQDYLNSLKTNFELKGETCFSPRMVLKNKTCHCFEGALLAATALRIHGQKPLIVDMVGTKDDWDHIIAVFKKNGKWGAISKTNHGVLRYREPVYRDIKELVMSYFHEYFDKKGRKTLRGFSNPVDLSRFDRLNWMTSEEDVWYIHDYLENIKHNKILTGKQISGLRKADEFEIKIGNMIEEKEPKGYKPGFGG